MKRVGKNKTLWGTLVLSPVAKLQVIVCHICLTKTVRGTQLEIYFIWLDTQEERVLLALCEYRERKEEREGEMCLLIFICMYVCVSG